MPDVPSYREMDLDGDGTICGLGFSADLETVRSDLREKLTELSASGSLNGGQANALGARIQRAEALLAEGKAGAASNVLEAFVLHVEALARGGVLTPEDAAELAVRARILIDLIA